MIKRKKRRGASLVMVVILVTFIFTTGSAMLTLVNLDFRTRIAKSDRIKSIYGADSGLNLVKNIIMKESNAAIIIANNNIMQGQILGKDIGFDKITNGGFVDTTLYDNINKYFKWNFINSLVDYNDIKSNSGDITKDSGIKNVSSDEFEKRNNLLYSITNLSYNTFKMNSDFGAYSDYQAYQTGLSKILTMGDGIDNGSIFNNVKLASGGEYPIIKIKEVKVVPKKSDDGTNTFIENSTDFYIQLTVESTFESKSSTATYPEKKTITANYIIKAPDYKEALKTVAGTTEVHNYSFIRAITADGNINVGDADNNSSNLTLDVNGGVWAKGEIPSNTTNTNLGILGLKYSNGILVNNATFNISANSNASTFASNRNGDLYTNGSLSLINNAIVNIAGSVYSKNVYAGIVGSVSNSANNKLTATNIVTNNDMVMNSTKSSFTMDNYYGINDVTDKDVSNGSSANQQNLAKQSSSIIVNNSSGNNTININSDAYISGVAYLDVSKSGTTYQTGESVAVDGNYAAYQDILPGYGGEVSLKNFSGYDLIDGSAQEKSKYFNQYYDNDKNKEQLKDGGVIINKIHAYGASVTNNRTVSNGNLDDQSLKDINAEKVNYTSKVLKMESQKYDSSSQEWVVPYKNSIVSKGVSVTGVDEDNKNNGIVDFIGFLNSKPKNYLIMPNLNDAVFTDNYYPYLFYSPDVSNRTGSIDPTITIKPDGIYVNGENKIKADKNTGVIKAVIITSGDVNIEAGDDENGIKFEGSIISGGNVNITGKKVTINFDESKVKIAIADLVDFNTVLDNYIEQPPVKDSGTENIPSGTKLAAATATVDTSIQRYDSDLLKEGLWTLAVKQDEY